MKKTLKLVPAIAMLLISAVMLSTATFAWFSMNNRVTVTGMTLTTKVSSNLLIAETNAEANFQNALTQTRTGLIEPTSTVNGIAYYWTATSNVKGDGDAVADAYTLYDEDTGLVFTDAGKTDYDDGFNTNYGFTSPTAVAGGVAYGYIDYTFYLKATNTSETSEDLKLTSLKMQYNSNDVFADKAWRVAVMAHSTTVETAYDTAWAASDVVSIYTLYGADNFTSNSAVSAADTVSALSYGTSKTTYNQEGIIATLTTGQTAYYKVTIRVWLEGEDTTCTASTYATLTDSWTLEAAFELDTDNLAVNTINEVVATGTGDEGSVTLTTGNLSNGATPTAYAWKQANGTAASGTNDQVTYTASASGVYYCEVTTASGTYRTNNVQLTVG